MYSSVHDWIPAQGPTVLSYLLCCCLVLLILKEILGNVDLNVRKLGVKDFWIFHPITLRPSSYSYYPNSAGRRHVK